MGAGARRIVLIALAIGFGLRGLASWGGMPGAWGLDTLRHLPSGWAAALVGLGALGFLPGVSRPLESALDRLGAAWERSGLRLDAVLAMGLGIVLFSLPDPTRFVGDADVRFAQLFTDAPSVRVFPQATALDRWVNIEAARALVRLGYPPGIASQAVPALIGAVVTLVLFAFIRAAGAVRGDLPGVAAFLLGSAIPIHMAGYGKFGLLLLGIALGGVGVLLMAREGRGALLVGLGTALALLAHRSGYLLLPAALVVLALGWRSSVSGIERREVAFGAALALGAAALEWPHALGVLWRIDRVTHLAGVASRTAAAGVLAAAWTALQNLFFVLPSWTAGMAAALVLSIRPPARAAARFGLGRVATVAGAVMVLEVMLVRGAQGEVRDWDMHVAPVLTLGLLGAYALIVLGRCGMPGLAAPLTTSALASGIALWSLHANELWSYARIDAQLRNPALWTETERARAYDFLGMRAMTLGAPAAAIRYLEAAIAIAPNPRYLCEVGGALRLAGRPIEAAARYHEARRRDPANADPWLGLGALALDRGDYQVALDCARRARALAPDRRDARELEQLALEGAARPAAPR